MSPQETISYQEKCKIVKLSNNLFLYSLTIGNNMSVLGSALEIDLDPDGDLTCVPRHVGNTGTGCFRMHDHTIRDTKKTPTIPPNEKIEATYMYAPTPVPSTSEASDDPDDDEDKPDTDHKDGSHKKNGKGPGA